MESLSNVYKYLHQNPELSLQEKKTSNYLIKELIELGYQIIRDSNSYGFIAIIKNGQGKCLMYRTDMDALPMKECSGLYFESKVTATLNGLEQVPVSHMCGHDMHMTVWLGVARYFAQNKTSINGTLVMLAQPAEELGLGAQLMLKNGLYEHFMPNFCLAYHINPILKAGEIGICKGYSMSGVDFIDIDIRGIGGHAAAPHATVDPIVLASQFVLSLQTIVSRRINPHEQAVVTVASINGGTKNNIIPDTVSLKLTIRWFKDTVRNDIIKNIKNIAIGLAIAAGLPESLYPQIKINEQNNVPSNYNHPDFANQIEKITKTVIAPEAIKEMQPTLFGEDFSYFAPENSGIQGMLLWLGSTEPHLIANAEINTDLPGLHSSKLILEPEETINNGVKCMIAYITTLLS